MTVPQKFLFFHEEMSPFKKKKIKITWVFGELDAHYSTILKYATTRQRKNINIVKSGRRKIRKELKLYGRNP